MSNVFSKTDLEILIATQNKIDFDFLTLMFPFAHFSQFTILIINQTQHQNLKSNYESVRVINTNEKGISKSRNLAIANATKKICLITDDDVIFSENFENSILEAFITLPQAAIITFNHLRFGVLKPQKKTYYVKEHDFKSIWNVSSIEVAFKLDEIKKKKLFFDTNFGLGSYFESAEEFLFLRESLRQNLKLFYSPQVIVSHAFLSSGKLQGTDNLIFAKAALYYKIAGNWVYFWLLKYILFLWRNNFIKKSDVIKKYKTGLSGIDTYKKLENAENEKGP